jgi:hypothetical protein
MENGYEYYILVSDPDELFEKKTFENLLNIATFLEKTGYNAAGFQCRSVSLKGPKRVWESLDDYWKHLFYRYEKGLHYVGNPHEGMRMPSGFKMLNTNFIYEHIKQDNVIYKRGARNSFVGGGGKNVGSKNLLWVELKGLIKKHYGKDLSWHEYEEKMLKGNLPQEIKEWIIKARLDDGWDGASEMREHYKYYFRILHTSRRGAGRA